MGYLAEVEVVSRKLTRLPENNSSVALRSTSYESDDFGIKISSNGSEKDILKVPLSFKNRRNEHIDPDVSASSKKCFLDHESALALNANRLNPELDPSKCIPELFSPRPKSELDAAAVKLQKVYKSYRTRRNLADCAVVVEELWWKATDFVSLKHSSITFFNDKKPETAVSRWSRALTRAAKVGKGMSKNEKAQKLALRHWLEAIDPRHRYGHNLQFYYDAWFYSESTQPFFYWLDVGDGKEVNLEKCTRNNLQQQCIKYLGPNEREAYKVMAVGGKLVYKQSQRLVHTVEGSKWIFVLSTSRDLYVGQKTKGRFQHSSFLSGGATTSAGRLVVKEGILKAIWPYSGHYLPNESNFKEFINFLRDNNVNLTDVKTSSIDDDDWASFKKRSLVSPECLSFKDCEYEPTIDLVAKDPEVADPEELNGKEEEEGPQAVEIGELEADDKDREPTRCLPGKWSTGAGPRIGCVRDYPASLQCKALEQVNLSPRIPPSPTPNIGPIPSPRPTREVRISPSIANLVIPRPTITLTLPKPKRR